MVYWRLLKECTLNLLMPTSVLGRKGSQWGFFVLLLGSLNGAIPKQLRCKHMQGKKSGVTLVKIYGFILMQIVLGAWNKNISLFCMYLWKKEWSKLVFCNSCYFFGVRDHVFTVWFAKSMVSRYVHSFKMLLKNYLTLRRILYMLVVKTSL